MESKLGETPPVRDLLEARRESAFVRRTPQLALFTAPLLLAGRRSRSAFGGPDPTRIGEALALTRRSAHVGRNGPAGDPLLPADCDVWYPKRRAGRRATRRGR